jgi:hypothetical protein
VSRCEYDPSVDWIDFVLLKRIVPRVLHRSVKFRTRRDRNSSFLRESSYRTSANLFA